MLHNSSELHSLHSCYIFQNAHSKRTYTHKHSDCLFLSTSNRIIDCGLYVGFVIVLLLYNKVVFFKYKFCAHNIFSEFYFLFIAKKIPRNEIFETYLVPQRDLASTTDSEEEFEAFASSLLSPFTGVNVSRAPFVTLE